MADTVYNKVLNKICMFLQQQQQQQKTANESKSVDLSAFLINGATF